MGLLIIIALPLAVYLSLALVPAGRSAAIAIAVALGFVGLTFALQPQIGLMIFLALAGIAMAAVAQAVRHLAGTRLSQGLYLKLLGVPPLVAILILTFSLGE